MLFKRFEPDSRDAEDLRLLKQMVYLLEQNLTYNLITHDEYRLEMEKVEERVRSLEIKYGTCTD